MIHVLADIELAPGVRDEFIKIFKANVPAVQAEDGCVEYSPAIDTTSPICPIDDLDLNPRNDGFCDMGCFEF